MCLFCMCMIFFGKSYVKSAISLPKYVFQLTFYVVFLYGPRLQKF